MDFQQKRIFVGIEDVDCKNDISHLKDIYPLLKENSRSVNDCISELVLVITARDIKEEIQWVLSDMITVAQKTGIMATAIIGEGLKSPSVLCASKGADSILLCGQVKLARNCYPEAFSRRCNDFLMALASDGSDLVVRDKDWIISLCETHLNDDRMINRFAGSDLSYSELCFQKQMLSDDFRIFNPETKRVVENYEEIATEQEEKMAS